MRIAEIMPANLTAIDLVRSGEIGRPRFSNADFAMQLRAGNIRTQKLMGGGVLHDLGIHCVNAARHLFTVEPLHAIVTSARRGVAVDLAPTRFLGPRLELGHAMRVPAHARPKLVQARGPSL